jgi:hypothetical protein
MVGGMTDEGDSASSAHRHSYLADMAYTERHSGATICSVADSQQCKRLEELNQAERLGNMGWYGRMEIQEYWIYRNDELTRSFIYVSPDHSIHLIERL